MAWYPELKVCHDDPVMVRTDSREKSFLLRLSGGAGSPGCSGLEQEDEKL